MEKLLGFRNPQEKLEQLFFFQVPRAVSLVEFQVPKPKISLHDNKRF
jgi:hypothetical protein